MRKFSYCNEKKTHHGENKFSLQQETILVAVGIVPFSVIHS